VEFAEIAINYDPPNMSQVYKMSPDLSGKQATSDLRWLGDLFHKFRAFFIEAATAQETVIYWID